MRRDKSALGRFTQWNTGEIHYLRDNDNDEVYTCVSGTDCKALKEHIVMFWDKGNTKPFVHQSCGEE